MADLTNDQITAGAAVLAIPTAILHLPCNRTMSHFATVHEMNSYKEGHRDARHAAADLVLARADELKALAAPSPQIAEVAEFSERQAFAAAMKEAWPGTVRAEDDEYWTGQYGHIWRSAIAASRRAGTLINEGTTPAPASAGQAKSGIPKRAWSKEAEMMESWVKVSTGQAAPSLSDEEPETPLRPVILRAKLRAALADPASADFAEVSKNTIRNVLKALAAQPAEGAGQAGQVAMTADELAALRRFYECAADGEGYDVPKPMMRRLSEIGGRDPVYQVWQFGVGGWRDTTRQKYEETHAGYRQIVNAPVAVRELDVEAERDQFSQWHLAKFGYKPSDGEAYGHPFDIWLAARSAAQGTAPMQDFDDWCERADNLPTFGPNEGVYAVRALKWAESAWKAAIKPQASAAPVSTEQAGVGANLKKNQ